jgi:glycosyltransferase involved in cell wall biosynthesis
MNRLPISVCMISGAEAHRIGRALESVAGWASEIVIVLNEDVRDGTEELAVRHGAKVYREPWKGHVAQKNSAAEKATQDWLLGLDADEVISAELKASIERLLGGTAAVPRQDAFRFARCTMYCGRWIRHGDWYPDRKTRLWRRGRARWGGIDPHDRIEVEGGIGDLSGDLLHYSMESVEHQVEKMARYATDFARGCKAQGRKVSWLDLAVRPPWRFLRSFVFKMGFLDGWQGFSIAWMTAFYTFVRYLKALEVQTAPPA